MSAPPLPDFDDPKLAARVEALPPAALDALPGKRVHGPRRLGECGRRHDDRAVHGAGHLEELGALDLSDLLGVPEHGVEIGFGGRTQDQQYGRIDVAGRGADNLDGARHGGLHLAGDAQGARHRRG